MRLSIIGSGESGQGAALLSATLGFETFVSESGMIDNNTKEFFTAHNIAFEEGSHDYKKLLHSDIIVKSPGISSQAPVIEFLRNNNKEIIAEIEFGFRYKGHAKVMAVTGSNGKSTTVTLLHKILKDAGLDACLCGNIGSSFCRNIIHKHDVYVLEVSSFQLDDIKYFKPDYAILLNITPDHLDRYHHDFDAYLHAKFKIIDNLHEGDVFIYNDDDAVIRSNITKKSFTEIPISTKNTLQDGACKNGNELFYEGLSIPVGLLKVKGSHNHLNLLSCMVVCKSMGLDYASISKSITTFRGLEHRLEYVGTVNGASYYNDSKATNLDAATVALSSFKQPIIWIMGGKDKGNDYEKVKELVISNVKAIIALGKDNRKIVNFFNRLIPVYDTHTVKEAVQLAVEIASKEDIVLLSPACASQDLFKDFEERGCCFKKEVERMSYNKL